MDLLTSYSLKKHPSLTLHKDIAQLCQDFLKKADLDATYPNTFVKYKQELLNKYTIVLHNVDAQAMHQHEQLKVQHFERIHFNCPHDGSDYKKQSLPPILKPSGSKLNPRFSAAYNQFYKAYIYDVYNASRAAGYSLIS